jgi:hypothetical protein
MASSHSEISSTSDALTIVTGELQPTGGKKYHVGSVALSLQPTIDGSGLEATHILMMPASAQPVALKVHSSISALTAQRLRSAAAVAIQRRRRCGQIATAVRELSAVSERADFHTFTFPIFDDVRSLHNLLLRSEETEGNTCVILRYVRNSFMDGGWNHYRGEEVVKGVAAILDALAKSAEVAPAQARSAFTAIHSLGLRPHLRVDLVGDDEAG